MIDMFNCGFTCQECITTLDNCRCVWGEGDEFEEHALSTDVGDDLQTRDESRGVG